MKPGGDFLRVQHHVELGLHLAIDQIQQNRIRVDRRWTHRKLVFATICAMVDLSPSTMLAVVPIVVVLPPAAICPAAPKYCIVVGALSDVSVPFHSATSCAQHHAVDGVHQVLRLQISELLLLLPSSMSNRL